MPPVNAPRSFSVVSLGCAKNSLDSERIAAVLGARGIVPANDPATADVVIVSTCSFIDPAKAESIEAILQAGRLKIDGLCRTLVVAGCMVESDLDDMREALPEVDLFVGLDDIASLPHLLGLVSGSEGAQDVSACLRMELPRIRRDLPWAYLQLADGCNHRCAYCAIPSIRGSLASRRPADILREARGLATQGVRELDLIAQDVTQLGRDTGGRGALPDLLRSLSKVEGIAWIRLLYVHPSGVDDELVAALDELPEVCAYMDIPIQHASERVLSAMERGYGPAHLEALFARLRGLARPPELRTSVLVGFPGETEAEFDELTDLLLARRFRQVAVFSYSAQPGTPAAAMPGQLDEVVRRERCHRLALLLDRISSEHAETDIGRAVFVLVETSERGRVLGRTDWQAPEVDGVITARGSARPGSIVRMTITESDGLDMKGNIVDVG